MLYLSLILVALGIFFIVYTLLSNIKKEKISDISRETIYKSESAYRNNEKVYSGTETANEYDNKKSGEELIKENKLMTDQQVKLNHTDHITKETGNNKYDELSEQANEDIG